jgi:hypothetical protein
VVLKGLQSEEKLKTRWPPHDRRAVRWILLVGRSRTCFSQRGFLYGNHKGNSIRLAKAFPNPHLRRVEESALRPPPLNVRVFTPRASETVPQLVKAADWAGARRLFPGTQPASQLHKAIERPRGLLRCGTCLAHKRREPFQNFRIFQSPLGDEGQGSTAGFRQVVRLWVGFRL